MPYFTCQQRRLHYRIQGEGPLVVILPGNTSSSAVHSADLDYFAGLGYRAAALDYAGVGQSERIPRPWPLDWFKQNAAQCAGLIEALGEEQAVLVGTSGGAITALWAAILYPQRVRAVVADSEGRFYTYGVLTALLVDRSQRTAGQVAFWSDAQGEDWAEVVEADSEFLRNLDEAHAAEGGWLTHEGRLGEIRCPALLTCALTDELIPQIGPQMLQMAAEIRESRFMAVNGGGHPLMASRPDAFRGAVNHFLDFVNLSTKQA